MNGEPWTVGRGVETKTLKKDGTKVRVKSIARPKPHIPIVSQTKKIAEKKTKAFNPQVNSIKSEKDLLRWLTSETGKRLGLTVIGP